MNDGQILAELVRVKAMFQLRAIETVIRGPASVDTHPKDGDVKQAPLVSGAVPKADAQPGGTND